MRGVRTDIGTIMPAALAFSAKSGVCPQAGQDVQVSRWRRQGHLRLQRRAHLAGGAQGLNLGLRDVMALRDAVDETSDPGAPTVVAAYDRARQAVQAGQVLPLPTVLERLQREVPGQVLEVELEQERERWIYEIKLLTSAGQLTKVKIDARTAEVLRVRSRESREDQPRSRDHR
eukprot:gene40280-53245_t